MRWRCGQGEICGPADAGGTGPVGAYDPGREEFCQGHNPGRVLLKTDEGWSASRVAQALDVSEGTVFRLKRRFAEDGLEGV